jgi:T-complex protein 1 subunit zeta
VRAHPARTMLTRPLAPPARTHSCFSRSLPPSAAQGDGTTSSVLFVGELLKYAERYISEGVHPRIIADGFELAKTHALEVLDRMKVAKGTPAPPAGGAGAAAAAAPEDAPLEAWRDREFLVSAARTALRTKLHPEVRC